jgi:hypothetical protein
VGLGDDHVGRQRLQGRLVDGVERLARPQLLAHAPIDLVAAAGDVEGGAAQRRQAGHPGRVIALVGAPDQLVPGAQRAHELGPAGQQRYDAHRPIV